MSQIVRAENPTKLCRERLPLRIVAVLDCFLQDAGDIEGERVEPLISSVFLSLQTLMDGRQEILRYQESGGTRAIRKIAEVPTVATERR